MKNLPEIDYGSGNIFSDFGVANPDLEQLRCILAAKIINALDDLGEPASAVESRTGIAAADLSRIRKVKLDKFTVDRLIKILGKLNKRVSFTVFNTNIESTINILDYTYPGQIDKPL